MTNKGWSREPARHSLAARGVKTKFGKKLVHLQTHIKNTPISFIKGYSWQAAKSASIRGVTVTFPDFKGWEFMSEYEMMMFFIWEENGIAQIGIEDNANNEIFNKTTLDKPLDTLKEYDILKFVNWYVNDYLHQEYAEMDYDELSVAERKKAMNLGKMKVTSLVDEAVTNILEGDVHKAGE